MKNKLKTYGQLIIAGLLTNLNVIGQTFSDVSTQQGIQTNFSSTDLWGSGLSFYDFDNDGWDDLTFVKENDSILFYKNNQGNFTLINSFIYGQGEVKHVLWVDYDNDGDLDLFMTILNGPYKMFQNDGNFNFTDVSTQIGLAHVNAKTYGASFGDYNRDGYLDLYIAKYEMLHPPGLEEKYNQLYLNNGDGTFTNVTDSAGVGDGYKASFHGIWWDYNEDGWPDLYVINDRSSFNNSLYENKGDGTFVDVTIPTNTGMNGQDPMTTSIADFDNDGDLDIYITNTGNFKTAYLYINQGNNTFSNMAFQYGVDNEQWSWGALWIDYDNDTWQDLYVTSGQIGSLVPQTTNYFYKNGGVNGFSNANHLFLDNHVARSFAPARGDFNNDGYYDIAVLNNIPQNAFLWENAGGSNNYIKITPHGTKSNTYAIGTWFKVYADGNQYTQYTFCGENYMGQNSQHHIFGLANMTDVDSIEVIYNSGHKDTYYNPTINTHHHFTEGETWKEEIQALSSTQFCDGDSVILSVGNFDHYQWNTGDTSSTITVYQPGLFSVLITNEFGVKFHSDTVEVSIILPPLITENYEHISCYEANDGTIDLNIDTTLMQSYTVNWSHGESGISIQNLSPGLYTYNYQDENACIHENTILLTEPYDIDLQTLINPELNGNDGELFILTNGGTPPYQYIFNQQTTAPPYFNLGGGTYQLTIVDANNCVYNFEITIPSYLATQNLNKTPFKIYPNPIQDKSINIETEKAFININFTIFNSKGEIIDFYHIAHLTEGKHEFKTKIKTPGVYLISIKNQSFDRTYQIIRE